MRQVEENTGRINAPGQLDSIVWITDGINSEIGRKVNRRKLAAIDI
jgi:hypothetical protein